MLSRYISKKLSPEIRQSRLSFVKSRLENLSVDVRAFLFGSAAHDDMDEHSDIDVYVIFKDLRDLKESQRALYSASGELLSAIDWVLTTEEDHAKRSRVGGLPFDIEKDGLPFFTRTSV